MIVMGVLSRNRGEIAMQSVDTMKTENIVTEETNMPRGINIQRSGEVCQSTVRPMETFGRKIPWTGSTSSRTTTAILSITINLRGMDQREEFLGVNHQNENQLDEQYQRTTAHPNMDFRPDIAQRGMITQIALVHQDTTPQIVTVHHDIAPQTAISHLRVHHLKDTRRKEAPGLLSDCIEISFGKSRIWWRRNDGGRLLTRQESPTAANGWPGNPRLVTVQKKPINLSLTGRSSYRLG